MSTNQIPTWLALALVAALALTVSCRTSPSGPSPSTAQPVFRAEKLAEMDAAIEEAIAAKKLPGGVLWLEHRGQSYRKACGQRAVLPAAEPMTEDTIFDVASLTKVAATTPAVMWLVERGQVKLDAPVRDYLPEFAGNGRDAITVRHLLTHTSGLRPDIALKPDWSGYDAAIRLCCAEKPQAAPDEKFIYSDTNFILLGEIVRRVSGQRLDEFAQRALYGPLGMRDTGFNPPPNKLQRIAPTEVQNGQPLRGTVHDPRSRRMDGVAGHAGLFTTAHDLARYARLMLHQGELDGVRIFSEATVDLMTHVQTPPTLTVRRGLGWDIDSGYSIPRGSLFPIGSYGHTGWTGVSLWIDPGSESFVIFLSNRNHPDGRGEVAALRQKLGTLAAEAIVDFKPSR
ncbi:MAG: beta-lactamase family protein [Verrucomicrobia bacterium]|nr:beta-lactamase family protein [Verrucomicrobiota bacterium]